VLCIIAKELRSGRVVQLWQDELGPFPPYRLDDDALFIAYMNSAEFGCHIALGWGEPACSIDAYVEFRHLTNDGAVLAKDRPKGFYALPGAVRYFGEDAIDTAHKEEMRDRIIQGPPYSSNERAAILEYCREDVEALARLVPHLIPTIRSLPHAMFRAKFQWATAQQEWRGVTLSLSALGPILANWDEMKLDLVTERDAEYGIYEIEDGVPHWRMHRWQDYIRSHGMVWPSYPDGSLDVTDQTFREMAGRYPLIETLRELRYTMSKLRLNSLSVGNDGRNRTLLGAYGTKTARRIAPNTEEEHRDGITWSICPRAEDTAAAVVAARTADRDDAIRALKTGKTIDLAAVKQARQQEADAQDVYAVAQAAKQQLNDDLLGIAEATALADNDVFVRRNEIIAAIAEKLVDDGQSLRRRLHVTTHLLNTLLTIGNEEPPPDHQRQIGQATKTKCAADRVAPLAATKEAVRLFVASRQSPEDEVAAAAASQTLRARLQQLLEDPSIEIMEKVNG
jgi:hypothetical protein